MRIVFAGTPSIAVPALKALAQDHEVVAVLTAPDNTQSRKPDPENSAVKNVALELGLNVLQPIKLDAGVREQIAPLKPDILVCFAYGMIFGPKFLALFPKGGINIHPSLLPRLRGPSPISAAILAGLPETGISVQRLSLEMDAGDILLQRRFALTGNETTGSLSLYCGQAAALMAVEVVDAVASGNETASPQNHQSATYCHLVQKNDGFVDWSKPATEIERMVRAYDPWPHAWTRWDDKNVLILEAAVPPGTEPGVAPGTVLKVDKARGILIQTGIGLLAVRRLQLQGKKEMDFQSFMNGARTFLGSLLGGQLP